jgi:hypothetical protein
MSDGFLLFLFVLLMLSLMMQLIAGRLAAHGRVAQLAEESEPAPAAERAPTRPRRRAEARVLEGPPAPPSAIVHARPTPRREPRRAPSLRRAIVMMEILGPPRAVREATTPFS